MKRAVLRCLGATAALLASCSFSAGDFGETQYRCGPGETCPAGFHCADGICISGDASPQRDIDAQPADAAPACSDNLVANPSFESGTSGWAGLGGPIAQVNEGHDGDHAAQKCYDGTSSYYNVNDNPDSVNATAVGATYSLRAWLRSSTEQSLHAVIRAKDALDDSVEQTSTTLVLKPDWQAVTVGHTIEKPESAAVEVYFSVVEPVAGDCFQLDDICFLRVP